VGRIPSAPTTQGGGGDPQTPPGKPPGAHPNSTGHRSWQLRRRGKEANFQAACPTALVRPLVGLCLICEVRLATPQVLVKVRAPGRDNLFPRRGPSRLSGFVSTAAACIDQRSAAGAMSQRSGPSGPEGPPTHTPRQGCIFVEVEVRVLQRPAASGPWASCFPAPSPSPGFGATTSKPASHKNGCTGGRFGCA
jgi:hypothetical protein